MRALWSGWGTGSLCVWVCTWGQCGSLCRDTKWGALDFCLFCTLGQEKGSGTCSFLFLAVLSVFLCVTSPHRVWVSIPLAPSTHLSAPLRTPAAAKFRVHALRPLSWALKATLWPGSQPLPQTLAEPPLLCPPWRMGSRQNLAPGRTHSTSRPVPSAPHQPGPGLTYWGPDLGPDAISWIRDLSWTRSLYCSSDYDIEPWITLENCSCLSGFLCGWARVRKLTAPFSTGHFLPAAWHILSAGLFPLRALGWARLREGETCYDTCTVPGPVKSHLSTGSLLGPYTCVGRGPNLYLHI